MDAVKKLNHPIEFVMEVTWQYGFSLYAHLRQNNQTMRVINPLQSDALRELWSTSLRHRYGDRYKTQGHRTFRPNFSGVWKTFQWYLRCNSYGTFSKLHNIGTNVVCRLNYSCRSLAKSKSRKIFLSEIGGKKFVLLLLLISEGKSHLNAMGGTSVTNLFQSFTKNLWFLAYICV